MNKILFIYLLAFFLLSCEGNKTSSPRNTLSNVNESTLQTPTENPQNQEPTQNPESSQNQEISQVNDGTSEEVVDINFCSEDNSSSLASPGLAIERKIPVIGEETQATVILNEINEIINNGYSQADLYLCVQYQNESVELVHHQKSLTLLNTATEYPLNWQPNKSGLADIWITIAFNDGVRLKSITRELFSHPQKLYFNYWDPDDNQRWITSGMYPASDDLTSKKAQGIRTLKWVWGVAHQDVETLTSEQWAEMWMDNAVRDDHLGFVIDEFGAGSEYDQTMGKGISLVKEKAPDIFKAAYSVALSGDDMIAGFRDADLVIAETYTADWRNYSTFNNRYQSFIDAGVQDHGVAAIDLSSGIYNEELRQQIAYVRTQFPDMPGLDFYSNPPTTKIWRSIDQAIWDFYLRAALLIVNSEGTFTLRNLGALEAKDISIEYFDENNISISTELIASVLGNQQHTLTLPPDAIIAKIIPNEATYTTIDYQSPLEKLPITTEASSKALNWANGLHTTDKVVKPLESTPDLTVTQETSEDPRKLNIILDDYKENELLTVSFNLTFSRIWFYASIEVNIEDDNNKMGISFSHGDIDSDIPNGEARARFKFRNSSGRTGYTSTPGLANDQNYKVVMHYDPEQAIIRNLIFHDDELISDSGYIEVDSSFSFDRLSIVMTKNENSNINWQDDDSATNAVYISSGESPYVVQAVLSDLKVIAEKQSP